MNYRQVIKGFNNGTIDKNKWQIVMENDDGYWVYIGDDVDEIDYHEFTEEIEAKYGRPNGERDIVDILNAAGVNADWC
jgi:hypothetical protein